MFIASKFQAENIALFSLGVIRAESSQQEQIARQVVCGERVASATRRIRRFGANSAVKLAAIFSEWTRWVIGALETETVYLLVDETKLEDRLGVMVVGVAYEGRCIPLAWRCYQANSSSNYPAEGQVRMIEQLLQSIQAGMPADKRVIVMADRGIGTSPALCPWKPIRLIFLRIFVTPPGWPRPCNWRLRILRSLWPIPE